jgi:pimeloyl-ACP methyl ester carboxylesterase
MRSLAAAFAVIFTASAQVSSLPPPPGRLVDVDGRKIHLYCIGTGSPAVVIEAGASSFAIDFALVQPQIGKATRVCAYDRLGQGWSDPLPDKDPGVVATLHALLAAAGEKAPYVMVGASRGGLFVRQYVARYPAEVAGLVLVDPAHEDRLFTEFNGQIVAIASLTADQLRSTFRPGPPVKIPRRSPQMGAPFDLLPPALYKTRVMLDERLIASLPDSVPMEVITDAQESERAQLAALREARRTEAHPLGDRPLVILSRGADTSPERDATFAELARISNNSRHTVVPNAGHEIHLFAPAAVIEAVLDVVDAVRTGSPLRRRLVN